MKPQIIEVNPTELCNRKCSFCPRGSGYPNLNYNLSIDDAKIINDKLIEFEYIGSFHITGSGEPTLNPYFEDIVKIFNSNKNLKLKMTTNGDYIGKKDISFFKYFDEIRISVYDGDARYNNLQWLKDEYNVIIRKQYDNQHLFNNCGGWFPLDKPINKTCYIPFFRLKIDWNLNIRLCCHDWKEKKVIANLKHYTLHDIWYNHFRNVREELLNNNRTNLSPCKNCNVNGTMNTYTNTKEGLQEFNYFKKYYETT